MAAAVAGRALENALLVAPAAVLCLSRRLRLTRPAALGMFCECWCAALTGTTLEALFGFGRNQFDRLVHAAWGPLMTVPVRDALAGHHRALLAL